MCLVEVGKRQAPAGLRTPVTQGMKVPHQGDKAVKASRA